MLDQILPEPISGDRPHARAAVRVNLFMAATLHSAGTETAVKIRDLSAGGAQIESPLMPEVGSPIILSRGRLSVRGSITWRNDRRCGIHFAAHISVAEWMANPVNREQQRIDHLVSAVKAGVAPRMPVAAPAIATSDGVAQDLARVSLLLENLGDALASDPAVIAHHGVALQNLDIAMQMLAALGGPNETGTPARLAELRKSCAQALANAP
ncbi:MAG: PilZ domain-containing protein [Sphingomicrobium sp.]